jgi:hypothetical protein
MARQMPGLEAEFRTRVAEAIRLAQIGEVARAESVVGSDTRKNLHHSRIELLYELAYLRIFSAWEAFLEQTFFRYLCGYTSRAGTAIALAGTSFSTTLGAAELRVLSGRDYVLWHSPSKVVQRSQRFFQSCPLEIVLQSNISRLEALASIRHRITHSQNDARKKFDTATMSLAGKRYRGSRPGAFLRDYDVSLTPQVRWLEELGHELMSLAIQIA